MQTELDSERSQAPSPFRGALSPTKKFLSKVSNKTSYNSPDFPGGDADSDAYSSNEDEYFYELESEVSPNSLADEVQRKITMERVLLSVEEQQREVHFEVMKEKRLKFLRNVKANSEMTDTHRLRCQWSKDTYDVRHDFRTFDFGRFCRQCGLEDPMFTISEDVPGSNVVVKLPSHVWHSSKLGQKRSLDDIYKRASTRITKKTKTQVATSGAPPVPTQKLSASYYALLDSYYKELLAMAPLVKRRQEPFPKPQPISTKKNAPVSRMDVDEPLEKTRHRRMDSLQGRSVLIG